MVAAALDRQLADLFADSGPYLFYICVWLLVFAGTGLLVGVFLPFVTGDSLLFAAGLVAAANGSINPYVLAVGVGVAAFFGDQVGFILGRRLGRPYLERHSGPVIQRWVTRTESFYSRWGWSSVVIARFVPVMRSLIPPVAGVARMDYWKFLSANAIGAAVWGTGMSLTGFFAASVPQVKQVAYGVGFLFITMSVVAGWRAWRQERSADLEDRL